MGRGEGIGNKDELVEHGYGEENERESVGSDGGNH